METTQGREQTIFGFYLGMKMCYNKSTKERERLVFLCAF